ncbi:aldehyde dehydrogenase [Pelagicoccus sp. SDUM812003]|uniref:aldehyde dehydrogenase n=1 Tax=Pelagicoccus sp. SDUM812003 TaxID=3041267 RepID=UPI00280F8071|nr:aldehyde dehydrogenase [Pelagicoccus sp. SDUM812003]MDQ8204637.1 aldehyde dehydrogenase [Pelagicoccus sp. SDUM812003]
MKTLLDEESIRQVVEQVIRALPKNGTPPAPAIQSSSAGSSCGCGGACSSRSNALGVFEDADEACAAAHDAYLQLKEKGVEARSKVVEIVKTLCTKNAKEWGIYEFEETKIGRLEHKIEKLEIVKLVPGVEWLRPDARSGDHGITMEEYTPFGVVGAITPVTHSVPTLSGNIINIVAAGNSVVFNPHPGGAKSAAKAIRVYNEAIERETGIKNLVCCVEKPSLESFNSICQNEHVRLMAITGGPAVVEAAMKSGKRSICAGPGNPPVLVDVSANIAKAAQDIIAGGAYDNNLLCIGEKQVFVVESVFDRFIREFEKAGAARMNDAQLERLTGEVFTYKQDGGGCSHPVLNRELVGMDAAKIAQRAGLSVAANTPMIYAITDAENPFVVEEQMMPVMPIVKVRDVHEGVRLAKLSEHNYKHSAMIHSHDVNSMTEMARALDCTVFVKNGPSVAGLGLGGEGYLSYSIATTTGEGITTPSTFTRKRRCVMVDNLRIY